MSINEKRIPLDRILFAALHTKIVEIAYPDISERIKMSKSKRLFYGYGTNIDDRSISAQMISKLNHHIRGRILDDCVREYNKGPESILISKKYLDDYLKFINLEFIEDLYPIVEQYKAIDPYFPPSRIDIKSEGYLVVPKYLKNISESKWRVYSHNHEATSKKTIKGIKCRILVFKENPYDIVLLDEHLNINLRGEVKKESNEKLLMCHLSHKNISLDARFRIEETGQKDIYMGLFLANDLISEIYTGSIILQRMKEEKDFKSEVFFYNFESEKINSIPAEIVDFFKYRTDNFFKLPALYDLNAFEWISGKKY